MSTAAFLQYVFCFPQLLLAFVIIKIKSSADILQGISKLDHLVQISIFQRKRGNFKRNLEDSFSDSEESRDESLKSNELNRESLYKRIQNEFVYRKSEQTEEQR